MRYSYYNPHLNLTLSLKAIFSHKKKAEESIVTYFKKITGKRYILITNSCRTALYLAYRSINNNGEVLTSPLTCKVAIDPIKESGNIPVYADINIGDLNINVEDIENRITADTIAIQAIHIGGVSCDMVKINAIAQENNLWIVEDCAQSLGARYRGVYSGSFGDISCFTLTKNAYGIGGGILATSSIEIYKKAVEFNKEFKIVSSKLTIYRFIRNVLETYRNSIVAKYLLVTLSKIKGESYSYDTVKSQLNKIAPLQMKVSAAQIARLDILQTKRKSIGSEYYRILRNKNFIHNLDYNIEDSSCTKFFVFNPLLNTKEIIRKFSENSIEAMHLEQKRGSPYQQQIIENRSAFDAKLFNYLKVHDSLVSLPLREDFSTKEITLLVNVLVE